MTTPLDLFLALHRHAQVCVAIIAATIPVAVWGFIVDASANHNPAAPLGLSVAAIAVVAWTFPVGGQSYSGRLHDVKERKALRWTRAPQRILIEPEGPMVRVTRITRDGSTSHLFHAEDDNERAMEQVQKWRDNPPSASVPTPEARALANVLAGRKP